jgi:NADPH:quinone reductase-like Zn-dependent oxidoreductase
VSSNAFRRENAISMLASVSSAWARTHGTYAEYAVVEPRVKADVLARIPDAVTDEQAAALPIPAVTALGSLDSCASSQATTSVVMGATGGVRDYAVQMARSRGAHVIATVRGDADEARRLGAEEVYDAKMVDVVDALRVSHPSGIDAVDLVNGSNAIRRAAEILKSGGRLVLNALRGRRRVVAERHVTAHNIASSANPLSSPQGLNEVARMLANGTIMARISSTLDLSAADRMLEQLRNRGLHGKAIIHL